jgi:hypothetical protein
MQLSDFPSAIAQTHRRMFAQDQLVRRLHSELDLMTATIDREIAFDLELRNDAQRKARRIERMNEDAYLDSANELQTAIDKRTDLQIELQLLRDRRQKKPLNC